MVNYQVAPGGQLTGEINLPGDKSISHRACILAAIAENNSELINFLPGEDNLHTLKALHALGVEIKFYSKNHLQIKGVGKHGLQPARKPLYLGNSGTGMRLLAGLLAGQEFNTTLTGDRSLAQRPMQRVIEPLTRMGAQITHENGALKIKGQPNLIGIDYTLPIPSAQVKSCLLLAALYASGSPIIRETILTRDHTENLLKHFNYPISTTYTHHFIHQLASSAKLTGTTIQIPGDFSSAAFFIVGACIAKNSDLIIKNIGLNPTRIGLLTLLEMMGANIEILEKTILQGEAIGSLRIKSSELQGITVPAHLIPATIDEFPIFFIAASCAQGETLLENVPELRVKESDRLNTMAQGLTTLGIKTTQLENGIKIQGGKIRGGTVMSFNDHRIAMAFTIAGLCSQEKITIHQCNPVSTSFPNFFSIAQQIGVKITEVFI